MHLKGPSTKLQALQGAYGSSNFPPTPPRCNETPYDADREDFKTTAGNDLMQLCGEHCNVPIYNCYLEKKALTLQSVTFNFTLSFSEGQSEESRDQAFTFAYKLYNSYATYPSAMGMQLRKQNRHSEKRGVLRSEAPPPATLTKVLFATAWCDLKANLGNLFISKCSNWNEMKNKEVVKKLMINKTMKDSPDNGEEKNVSYSVKYYCALTQVARLAEQFNVTGLVQFYRPMRTSQPTAEVVAELSKMLAAYKPVALHDEHLSVGCDMGVRSYRKKVQQKKNRRKEKQKKRFITITEYAAYCVALTGEFAEQVLEKIVDGTSTGDIKIILDSLDKQE